MIEIGKALVSFDVLRKKFCCNLHHCRGACCIYGDAGAPLTMEEAVNVDEYLDELSPFLSAEGLLSIIELGAFVHDVDGEMVTPLINNKECAYTLFVEGTAFCAIEKAFRAGTIPFNKPVSCHLYPIRIQSFDGFDAVNYDRWEICDPALDEGSRNDIPVYQFVRDALIRKYGVDWFEQLDIAAHNLDFEKYE